MASTTTITSGRRSTSSRNKTRKKMNQSNNQNQIANVEKATVAWKSDVQQQAYSSKLLHALRQIRLNSPPSVPKRGRAVREAADRVLAIAARGRTRWSRAILTNRLKLKFMKKSSNKRIQRASTIVTGNSRLQKKGRVGILRLKAKNLPAVQRKVKVLSRLVPGCRKQPMPDVLEEASDYIAALEMQVRAMSALAELLSGSGSMAASSSSGGGGSLSQLGSSHPTL